MIKRVLWPIDPYEFDELDPKILEFLKNLSSQHDIKVEPITVLVPDQINVTAVANHMLWVSRYREGALKKLKKLVESDSTRKIFDSFSEPKVLENDRGSARAAIHEVCEYATESNVDLIIIRSHGRKGIKRLFLGSFAEGVFLKSKVPVCILNPNAEVKRAPERALFPTDFSASSKKAFFELLNDLDPKTEIVLFHQQHNQLETYFGGAPFMINGVKTDLKQILEEDRKFREVTSQEWVSEAKQKGFQARFEMEQNPKDTAESIIEFSQKISADLIALASQSGGIESFLAGSITRSVAREAPVPVWILHSNSEPNANFDDTSTRRSNNPSTQKEASP